MTTNLGVGLSVVGVPGNTTRINTKSALDFAYWASTFVSDGAPSDYYHAGPETDGVSLISWAADQIGVTFPNEWEQAALLTYESLTVEAALRKRGAILIHATEDRMAVCLALGDIIDIVSGLYFVRRIETDTDKAEWSNGVKLPGAIY